MKVYVLTSAPLANDKDRGAVGQVRGLFSSWDKATHNAEVRYWSADRAAGVWVTHQPEDRHDAIYRGPHLWSCISVDGTLRWWVRCASVTGADS